MTSIEEPSGGVWIHSYVWNSALTECTFCAVISIQMTLEALEMDEFIQNKKIQKESFEQNPEEPQHITLLQNNHNPQWRLKGSRWKK